MDIGVGEVDNITEWLRRLGGKDCVDVIPGNNKLLQIRLDAACVVCVEGHARFRVIRSRFSRILSTGDVPHMVLADVHYLFWSESDMSKFLMYTFKTDGKYAGMSFLTKCNLWASPQSKNWRVSMGEATAKARCVPPELLAMCSEPRVRLQTELCDGEACKRAVEWTAVTCCMSFFKDAKGARLPKGFTIRHFDEAVAVLTTGHVVRPTGDGEYYRKVLGFLEEVAGYQGTPEIVARAKIHLQQMACLADHDPLWLFCIVEDRNMLFGSKHPPTINVTHGVMRSVGGLQPPSAGLDKWRFYNVGSVPTKYLLSPDENVFHTPTHNNLGVLVENGMPWYVRTVMQLFAGRLILAGGKVVGQILKDTCRGNDFDLFLCDNTSHGIIEQAIAELSRMVTIKSTHVSVNAITLVTADDARVQFITRNTYTNVGDLLHSFDIPACQAAFYYTSVLSHGKSYRCLGKAVKVTPSFMESARRHSFWLDLTFMEEGALPRAIKYFFKGFEMYVPGFGAATFNGKFA